MSSSGKKPTDDDEVEQLLREAQDDMLLKLSVHSHMARGSAAIDPDLDRRFQALRKPQKPAKIDNSKKKAPTEMGNKADGVATEDDLFTRFAALKNSLPSYSGIEDKNDESVNEQVTEEDEVEKVMQWAIDAARLDPSPLSDDDDDDNDDGSDDNDSDDSRGKKGKRK